MTVNNFIATLSDLFGRWFHKRNIIIVSERKVKHVPISGPLQFFGLTVSIVGICWASYSTGSFIAARSALKEQSQALRSVTNAHIENSFPTVFQTPIDPVNLTTSLSIDIGPSKHNQDSMTTNGPIAALSALDNAKLMARITLLENKVVELKNTNEAIVQRVHDKTSGRIDDLERIIKQTGLNITEMKKQVSDNKVGKSKHPHANEDAQGGPYIPEDVMNFSPQAKELFSSLDELKILSKIVSTIPLAMPIANSEEQSVFGHRIDPFNGHLAFHSGLDLAGPIGSKIYSTGDGTVVSAGRNGAYGNVIDIDHGYGIVTRYGHLSEILVQEGQQVKKGDNIGIQGSTGRSTGPHLHYEVRYHDVAMNPKNFLEAGQNVSEE